jgi:hypothetical protein
LPSTPLTVRFDPTQDVSVLYIGRDALPAVQPEKKTGFAPGAGRSMVAAIALSCGVAGVFLLRGRRAAQLASGLVLAVGLGALGVEAWGNAPPPVTLPPVAPPPFSAASDAHPKVIEGETVIEIVDGGRVELVIGTKPRNAPPGAEPAPAPKSSNAPAKPTN